MPAKTATPTSTGPLTAVTPTTHPLGATTRAAGSPGPLLPQGGSSEGSSEGFEFELSDEEKALLGSMTELLDVQVDFAQDSLHLFRQLAPIYANFFHESNRMSLESMARQGTIQAEGGAYIQQAMVDLRGTTAEHNLLTNAQNVSSAVLRGDASAMSISPQQSRLLDTVFGEQQRRGQDQIRQQAEELAAARGFNLTDTPIGGDYFLRTLGEFQGGLGAARAEAEIGLGVQQQQFREASAQFQQGLNAQARQNRAQLGVAAFGLGGQVGGQQTLPTVGGDMGGAASALSSLGANRNAQNSLMFNQQQLAQQAQLAREGFASAANVANINARGNQGTRRSGFDLWGPILGNALTSSAAFI